jgi:hypothetical protein
MQILLLVSPTARMRSRSTVCESFRAPVTALPGSCGRKGVWTTSIIICCSMTKMHGGLATQGYVSPGLCYPVLEQQSMCVLFHGVRRRQVGSTRPYHAECRVDGSRPLHDRTCYSHSKERTHGGVHERSMSVDHAWDACARRGVGGGRHGCSGGTDLGSQLFRRERCDAIIFWAASWARALPLIGVWPSGSANCVIQTDAVTREPEALRPF